MGIISPERAKRKGQRSETENVPRYVSVPLASLKPATLNDQIYKRIDPDDDATVRLAESIARTKTVNPFDVTRDWVIVSGHRRRAACMRLGITEVKVNVLPILSTDPEFEKYLVDFNDQRVKSIDEQIREEVIRTSPDDAHNELLAHREVERLDGIRRAKNAGLRILNPKAAAARSEITHQKQPMLDAVLAILEQYRDLWPLTLRQIHYRLLTRFVAYNPVRCPGRLYANNETDYQNLSDLLVRARLVGLVPWESMHDPTRPRTRWIQWENVGSYMREQLDGFLGTYKRNLLQSQPAYIELVVEKITAHDIAERAAGHYHVPVGVGKGYTSVTCLEETAERFHASGKDHFILLIAGDFDPEGENICETWVAQLRDEHGVENITPIKVGVNPDQVRTYNLTPLPVKKVSASGKELGRAKGFIEAHGESVYELEAFEPNVLQSIIRDAIRSVLDMDRFIAEQRKESEEARYLSASRKTIREVLKDWHPD